jgi:hypothetical protein
VLSARFPLVTPAGSLPGVDQMRRYVDGGYFENSGLTTILDVMNELRELLLEEDILLIILRIENSRFTTNTRSITGSPKPDPDDDFAEAMAPVRALLATRHARGELARATVARVIRDANAACAAKAANAMGPAGSARSASGCVNEVVFALEPAGVPIPLGWSLTESARREMQRQLKLHSVDASASCPGQDAEGRNACSFERVLRLVGAL